MPIGVPIYASLAIAIAIVAATVPVVATATALLALELLAEDLGPGLLALRGHCVEALVGCLSNQLALSLDRAVRQHLVLAGHTSALVQVRLVTLDVGVVPLFLVGTSVTVVVRVITT